MCILFQVVMACCFLKETISTAENEREGKQILLSSAAAPFPFYYYANSPLYMNADVSKSSLEGRVSSKLLSPPGQLKCIIAYNSLNNWRHLNIDRCSFVHNKQNNIFFTDEFNNESAGRTFFRIFGCPKCPTCPSPVVCPTCPACPAPPVIPAQSISFPLVAGGNH